MFKLKLVTSDYCDELKRLLEYTQIPMEVYSDYTKEGIAVKRQFGARESPFAIIYYKDKPIRGFYNESSECTADNIINCIRIKIKELSPKGKLIINRKGSDEYVRGDIIQFIEGASLIIVDDHNKRFRTSIIENIDWENKIFKTKYTTYLFDYENRES